MMIFFGVPPWLRKAPYDQVDIMGVKGIDSGRPAENKLLLGYAQKTDYTLYVYIYNVIL